MTVVTIDAWNVRTLLERSGTDRPERWTTLIASELSRYKVHIYVTRLGEEGHLTKQSAVYKFSRILYGKNERYQTGVGIVIKSNKVNMLAARRKGINEHLMAVCLSLPRKKFAKLISAYGPTMTNLDVDKDILR